MRFSTYQPTAAFLLSLPIVSAFANTSPFFLFSTEPLPSDLGIEPYQSVATADTFLDSVKKVISQCTSDTYLIVSQPGIHASDLAHIDSAPRLRARMIEAKQESISVEHVSGSLAVEEIEKIITETCGAHVISVDASTGSFQTFDEDMTPKLIKVDFSTLPAQSIARTQELAAHDAFLFSLISMLPTTKYTVIYTSTPVEDVAILRTKPDDLKKRHAAADGETSYYIKRGLYAGAAGNSTNSTLTSGLFERYQYFTPGIFLSIMTIIILLAILSVALTAISSVKVSYLSFEKEMGPTEQKKQQ